MLTTLVLAILVIAVHEAGHAIARAACARRSFTATGTRVARLDSMVGAVDLEGPWRPDTFTRLSAARETAADALRVALGGPIASVAAGLAAIPTGHDIVIVGGLTSIVYGLATLIPFPGADGRRIRDAAGAVKRLRA